MHIGGLTQHIRFCGVLSASAVGLTNSSTVTAQLPLFTSGRTPRLSCAFLQGYVGAVRTGPFRWPLSPPPSAPLVERPCLTSPPRGKGGATSPLLCLICNRTSGIVLLKMRPHLLWDGNYRWPEPEPGPPSPSSIQSPGSLRHPIKILESSPQQNPAPAYPELQLRSRDDGLYTQGSALFLPDPGTGRAALMMLFD